MHQASSRRLLLAIFDGALKKASRLVESHPGNDCVHVQVFTNCSISFRHLHQASPLKHAQPTRHSPIHIHFAIPVSLI